MDLDHDEVVHGSEASLDINQSLASLHISNAHLPLSTAPSSPERDETDHNWVNLNEMSLYHPVRHASRPHLDRAFSSRSGITAPPTSPTHQPTTYRVPPNSVVSFESNPLVTMPGSHETENTPRKEIKKIACIGAGYVGGPTCAIIAYKNPSMQVTIADVDAERIAAWKSAKLPIYELGLDHIVFTARDGTAAINHFPAGFDPTTSHARNSSGSEDIFAKSKESAHAEPAVLDPGHVPNLFFTTDIAAAIAEAELIFLCVNTPTKETGLGKDYACNLEHIETATKKIAQVATTDKIIVEKSTVPCGTAQKIRDILHVNCSHPVTFEVLSNPEFLSEGTAVSDLLYPDRILIGSEQTLNGHSAAASLADVYTWVPRERMVFMNSWSSELAKLAANAMLAQRISSINALSAICEKTGADINEVAYACGLDRRIGPHMLKASVGFGGSCFRKDILNLVYLAESLHLYEVAEYWKSVATMNEFQKSRFTHRLIRCLNNSLTGKKIAILGFSYKKDTGDTRESPAITLIKNIQDEQGSIAVYDPQVQEVDIWRALTADGTKLEGVKKWVTVCHNVYDACNEANAVVVVTEWDEFSNKSIALAGPSAWAPSRAFSGVGPNGNNVHNPHNQVVNRDRSVSEVSKHNHSAAQLMNHDRTVNGIHPTGQSFGERRASRPIRLSIGSIFSGDVAPSPDPRRTIEDLFSPLPQDAPDRGLTTHDIEVSDFSVPNLGLSQESTGTSNLYPLDLIKEEEGKISRVDWGRVAEGMKKPMYVFDGRGILDVKKLEEQGFVVETIGVMSSTSRHL